MENANGSVKFESVTSPGGFLAIDVNKQAVQDMSIQLVVSVCIYMCIYMYIIYMCVYVCIT